jgi:biopolymer transport protein ExbB/TolQ
MSPEGQLGGSKPAIASNIYTVLVAAVFGLLLATAAFVAYKCFFDYGTLFKIP